MSVILKNLATDNRTIVFEKAKLVINTIVALLNKIMSMSPFSLQHLTKLSGVLSVFQNLHNEPSFV